MPLTRPMQDAKNYIEQLTKCLSELDPQLVLLFGSYANGMPDKDSHIDLLVVTKDMSMPQTFNEKIGLYAKVKRHISGINKHVPIDLLVYMLPMYQKFKELNSSFSREIFSKGTIIYESDNPAMA